MQRTEIASLGQFPLIDRLLSPNTLKHSSSYLGVGDDSAVITNDGTYCTLLSTDLLLEGIHFDLTYTPLRHLGYKAVVVAIADIYAMNGEPQQVTLSIGVSARFCVEDLEELYAGVYLACQHYGVDLVGGDTSASMTGLTLSLSAVGIGRNAELTLRSGAQSTDLICATGDFGAAYMGLQLLEREKRVFAGEEGEFQPDFAGREYILERQLKPEVRPQFLTKLRDLGILPTSMIDVSDGLSSDLLQIAKASGVGLRIYEERIPIDYETAAMAEEFNLNATTVALNGGEDYEFIFTVPLGLLDKVREIEGIRLLGHITDPSLGCCMITRDGTEIELRAQGFTAQQTNPNTTIDS